MSFRTTMDGEDSRETVILHTLQRDNRFVACLKNTLSEDLPSSPHATWNSRLQTSGRSLFLPRAGTAVLHPFQICAFFLLQKSGFNTKVCIMLSPLPLKIVYTCSAQQKYRNHYVACRHIGTCKESHSLFKPFL